MLILTYFYNYFSVTHFSEGEKELSESGSKEITSKAKK